MRRESFRPFADSGRRPIAAIMLAFAVYTCLSLVLSERAADRSEHRAGTLQVAARQRTLIERYSKEILLSSHDGFGSSAPIAHALHDSLDALLEGGTAPAIPGDDDEITLRAVRNPLIRRQLLEERRLVDDLVTTGDAVLTGRPQSTRLRAGEHFADGMSQLDRLEALTGLTSNVALNVARSIGDENDSNFSRFVSLQRVLAGLGLGVFALLGWALVTSTRRRSAHFRSLVTSTTDLVLVFGGADCRYVSNSVVRLLGCEVDEVLGGGLLGFVHEHDRAGLGDALRNGTVESVAFRLPDPDGSWHDLEATLTDLRDDRHVNGIVLNARDVTERNRAAAERERLLEQEQLANERLRELDRLKDEFVALVSHELRTPLTSINGFLELLSEDDLTDDQRGYTAVIGRNTDRLMRLINDLLFIAQIESGRLTVEHDDVDLAAIVDDALAAAAPAARAGGVDLRGGSDGPLPLRGDAVRLAQLLDNLISNAIKFTPAGGIVDVDAGVTGSRIWVEVRDSGIGIDQDDLERLFERFFRTEAAAKASIQGTGLGLAISRAIVQAHGGSIRVESTAGRGSTFTVELPVPAYAPGPEPARRR